MDILNGSKAGISREGIACYRIAVNGKLPGINQRRSQALICHSGQDGIVNFLNSGLVSSGVQFVHQRRQFRLRRANLHEYGIHRGRRVDVGNDHSRIIVASLSLEDGQSIVTALDHGIPVHHLRGLRGQLNTDLAGLVADVDNHVVIRGGAGLIQESGGQFDSILLTDTISISIYITGLIQDLIGVIQVKAVHRLLHIAVGQVTGKEGICLVEQATIDIVYHGILINSGRNGLTNHLVAEDLTAQVIAYIVSLQRLFIDLSTISIHLLHLSITLSRDIFDAGEEIYLTILHS